MEHTQTDILNIKGLKVSFSSRSNDYTVAVNGISYQLKKGEILGLVGESGSGKSVSSMSIMKLVKTPPGRYEAGQIFFDGNERVNLLELPEAKIRPYRGAEIAMIFQEPMTSLNPSHRCGRQVEEMFVVHTNLNKQERKRRVLELFGKVDLPDPERIYKSYPHELSGGQLQRVMIAMAIACKPKILIADEPTTALDVTVQKTILDLVKDLQEEFGNSCIFITHDLGVINQLADRVIVMYQGEIVEEGPVREIFDRPKHPYTKGLIACRPPLKKRFKRLPTVNDFLNRTDEEVIGYVKSLEQATSEYFQQVKQIASNPVLLEATDIKKYFPKTKNFFGRPTSFVKAVDGVSFQLRKGQTIGLVGESGCGKSTLGKVLMRLTEPTSGEVIFDGVDLLKLEGEPLRKLRKDFQIIFQDPYSSLNPRMTIGKAVREPLDVHGVFDKKNAREEFVVELLEKVGLEADHFHRYPHQFSGGQRQRICIARALALKPKFILCDESVSALDVSVQAQVLNLLQDLKEEFDLSYLFISHDLSVVKFISDEILVMNAGKIVERGNAEEVINDPKMEYTERLISAIPQ